MPTCFPYPRDAMIAVDRRRFLVQAAAIAAAGASARTWAAVTPGLTVETAYGRVRGRGENAMRIFTGIPYGRAARFSAPRAPAAWSGILDATLPPAVAPQALGPNPHGGTMSEDCLQLNIWAPQRAGPHPVMVYIHGGANETGWSGDAATAGDRFAAHDVVCVSANYRVGALGFLETGELLGPAYAGSANNGIRDLLLALGWVRANIAAFGGDPARVTLAGESAGGKNVATLMGVPAADGLYAGAALFSGGGQTVHTPEAARAFARLFARKLGGADRLLDVPMAAVVSAQAETKAAWPRNFPFRPMVDGRFLPQVPLRRIATGGVPRVPMLIGSNADESRLFLPPEKAGGPLREAAVANETMARMARLDDAYAVAFPDLPVADRHWRLLTAEEYGMPCLRIAEGHAACGASVYRYRLTYPAPGGPFAGHSPHVLDVPFTFDHVRLPGFAAFFGLAAADQPLADGMHGAMVRFVTGGRPSAPRLPEWRRYDTRGRNTMVLERVSAMVSDPDSVERRIWETVTG